jgi:hypothetical protein
MFTGKETTKRSQVYIVFTKAPANFYIDKSILKLIWKIKRTRMKQF